MHPDLPFRSEPAGISDEPMKALKDSTRPVPSCGRLREPPAREPQRAGGVMSLGVNNAGIARFMPSRHHGVQQLNPPAARSAASRVLLALWHGRQRD